MFDDTNATPEMEQGQSAEDTQEINYFGDDVPDNETPDDAEQAESTPQEQTYTVKVDGQEIQVPITELLGGYQRQQDYTKKTQELAEQRKAVEQVMLNIQQLTGQQQAQQQPENPYLGLATKAKQEFVNNFGEFDFTNDDHHSVLQSITAKLAWKEHQEQQQQQQFSNFVNEFRVKDPNNSQNILNFADEVLDNLPRREARKIEEAYQRGDTAILSPFLDSVAKQYYAKANGLPLQGTQPQGQVRKQTGNPPAVEGAGSGAEVKPDYKKALQTLAYADTKQAAKFASQYNIF
jgi:hypothetical protein